jgi:co-chaperonin GroES (HSP10)
MAVVKGTLKPLHNRVLVSDMEFGEQKTATGIIIRSDDGKTEGIKPRWGRVFAKGPENDDDYQIGDWILVEHGRWTRGTQYDNGAPEPITIRMVEAESIMMWSDEKPNDVDIREGIGLSQPVEAYRI